MEKSLAKLTKNFTLITVTVLSLALITACSNTNKSSNSQSNMSLSSSSSAASSSSSSSKPSQSSSSAAAPISQTDLIHLMAAWVENAQGLYEVQYFTASDGSTSYIFINGGKNGTGKDFYGDSSAGISLKSEQNSAQFLVKGDQVTFQVPSFPNGVSGNWHEIVWQSKATLSLTQLQSQFGTKAVAAAQQIVNITNSSPY